MIHGLVDFDALQKEYNEWQERNFPGTTPVHQALGCCEEAGELAHAVLKLDQGIRGTEEEHVANMKDAIGDFVIYAMGISKSYDFTIDECVKLAWARVRQRDWIADPQAGGER